MQTPKTARIESRRGLKRQKDRLSMLLQLDPTKARHGDSRLQEVGVHFGSARNHGYTEMGHPERILNGKVVGPGNRWVADESLLSRGLSERLFQ